MVTNSISAGARVESIDLETGEYRVILCGVLDIDAWRHRAPVSHRPPSPTIRRLARAIDGLLAKSASVLVVMDSLHEGSGLYQVGLEGRLERGAPGAVPRGTVSSTEGRRGSKCS